MNEIEKKNVEILLMEIFFTVCLCECNQIRTLSIKRLHKYLPSDCFFFLNITWKCLKSVSIKIVGLEFWFGKEFCSI